MKFIFILGVLSMSIFGNTLELGKPAPNLPYKTRTEIGECSMITEVRRL